MKENGKNSDAAGLKNHFTTKKRENRGEIVMVLYININEVIFYLFALGPRIDPCFPLLPQ